MKKIIILSALIIGLASCKKEERFCEQSFINVSKRNQFTFYIYQNGAFLDSFKTSYKIKVDNKPNIIQFDVIYSPTFSEPVFLDTIQVNKCESVNIYL